MPLREVRDRFTLSEMAMVGWRSQEQHWQLKKKFPSNGTRKERPKRSQLLDMMGYGEKEETQRDERGRQIYHDEVVDGLPSNWFNEEGELDLRKVSGPQAVKYMNAVGKELGLPLFPMVGMPAPSPRR